MKAYLARWILVALAMGVALVTAVARGPVPLASAWSSAAAVAAGYDHTCALTTLTTGGGLKCWGYNGDGQLGDGTTTTRSTAVDVSGLTSGVVAVAAGGNHTCVLTTGGALKCWGNNWYGQLGDGTTTGHDTPVDVSGLTSGVVAVAAGGLYGAHTCAVTTGGGVKCWGRNIYGQLGDGTTTNRSTPVGVSGLGSGVVAVAASEDHTCALTAAGGLKCWGGNGAGQLGDGTTTNRTTPVDVSGLSSGVAAVAAGTGFTCAVTTAGGVKCWGDNETGALGDGTMTSSSTPVDVSGLTSGVAAVAAGWYSTCAVTTTGDLKCWGNNWYGQLGDGTNTGPDSCGRYWCSTTPVDVSGLTSGVAAVSVGYSHACALTAGGDLKCWGINALGELGDGTYTGPESGPGGYPCSTVPVDVVGFAPDSDGDGCAAAQEGFGAPWPNPGSTCTSPDKCYSDSRWYDFFDVPVPANADPVPNGNRDGAVSMFDLLAVLRYVGTQQGRGPVNGLDYDADKNGDTIKDGVDYDRSSGPGPNPPWEAGPPDGAVSMFDIMVMLPQVGLSCAGPP